MMPLAMVNIGEESAVVRITGREDTRKFPSLGFNTIFL